MIRSKFDAPPRPSEQDAPGDQIRKAVVYSLTRRPFSTLVKGLAPADWNLSGFRSRFYREYESKQDAVEEALCAGIRPDRSELTDALAQQMAKCAADVAEGTTAPSTVINGLGDAYFTQALNDDVLTLQMLAWVAANEHESMKENFGELYDSLDERAVNGLSVMLEGWGRTPIPPYTWSTIATTLTALTEGLLIRHAVDPEAVPISLLGQVSVGIIATMTKHESETIESPNERLDDIHRPNQSE